MKIGIDGRLYRSGVAGIGRYTQELVKNLLEIDKENSYILFLTPADMSECLLSAPNLEKVVAPFPHYSLAEQTKFYRFLKRFDLDLMHFTNFNHPIRYRKPYVVTMHDLIMYFSRGRTKRGKFTRGICRYVIRDAARHAKKIIAVSKYSREDVIKHLGADPEKVAAIYEGVAEQFIKVNTEEAEKVLQKFNIKKPFILYVGRWNEHKNVIGAIGALALLNKEMSNGGVRLVLGGKRDQAFPEIPKTIAKLGLTDKVIITDFLSDEELAALYQTAECFIFPSLYEGFGLPPLEAMRYGLPVVSSNRTSLPEVLGEAAVYVDPLNVSEMADALFKVLTNKKFAESLARLGLRQVEKYSFRKMAEETLAIYRDAINGNNK